MAEQTEYDTNGKSDLTLLSGSDEYYVHQHVVCSQSPVLKTRCAALQETHSHTSILSKLTKLLTFWHHDPPNPTIDLSGQADVAIDAMIHFFYHGDYYPNNYDADTAHFDADRDFHADVLRVAKVYEVKELEEIATELLEKANGLSSAKSAEEVLESGESGCAQKS